MAPRCAAGTATPAAADCSGGPEEGGCALSRSFEAAGGTAVRYDNRIDPVMDFLNDDEFWAKVLNEPYDVMPFAIPCTDFSMAKSPKRRTQENPYGDETIEQTRISNEMVRLMCSRIRALVSKGAIIFVENPLLSFLWLLEEMLALCGLPHMRLVRTDHCQFGTPYQKPQLWLTNCPGAEGIGAVCCHPKPHAVRLPCFRSAKIQLFFYFANRLGQG